MGENLWDELSEEEKWLRLQQLLAEGKGPRRGRPRKDGSTVTWKHVGLTRMQVFYMRRLAEIPDFEAHEKALLEECIREGRRYSRRGLLVKAGLLKNVSDENIFRDTPMGELARDLLRPVEYVVFARPELTDRQRRWLQRALRARLAAIFRTEEAP